MFVCWIKSSGSEVPSSDEFDDEESEDNVGTSQMSVEALDAAGGDLLRWPLPGIRGSRCASESSSPATIGLLLLLLKSGLSDMCFRFVDFLVPCKASA